MEDLDVYAFIESRDRFDGSLPETVLRRFAPHINNSLAYGAKRYNGEIVFSMVADSYFMDIESEFGKCDRNNPRDRKKRISNINKYFGEGRRIYNGHAWYNLNTDFGIFIRGGLLPSQWFIVKLSTEKGYPIIRTSGADLDDASAEALFISEIYPVEGDILLRLREIFSLNHIPDLQLFNNQDQGGLLNAPITPPMSPDNEEMMDEFGELVHSQHFTWKLLWNYYMKNQQNIVITQFQIIKSQEDTRDTTNNNIFLRH